MSVEFRQRKPAEYVSMVWRNKWLVIVPTIAVALATAWVVRKLPNVYESKSVLIVRPATISSNALDRMNESELLFRINAINQEVMSRSSLEPLIRRYNLYKDELDRGASVEGLVARMQTEDVKVQIDRSDNEMPNAFNISFRSSDPNAARSVTAELATKYVNRQLEGSKRVADDTTTFFESRLAETKAQLDTIDRRRYEFMMRNMEILPDTGGALTQRLTGLYEQQKAYINEVGRMRDSISAIENQLNVIRKAREDQIGEQTKFYEDPKNTVAYATLNSQRSTLRAELQQMQQTLTKKNPDVIAKQSQLDDIQGQMDELVEGNKRRIEARQQELRSYVDPQSATLRSQLQAYKNENSRLQGALAQTNAAIGEMERRVNAVPGATITIQQLDRDYGTQKALYDDLLTKAEGAKTNAQATANSQGEAIQVVDAASLPQEPIAPKREMLYLFGIALGFGVGFLLVAAKEVPRLMRVQNIEDAAHYTGLPVLVSLPEMLTPRELRRRRLRRLTFAAAGLVLAVVSVPGLIVLFRFARVFNILGGVN